MEEKFKKIQFFIGISLIFVISIMLFRNPGITGHVTADFISQTLDIELDKSQSFILRTNSDDPIFISSFRFSGEVIGDGSVEIYIQDKMEKYLIYKNIRRKENGMASVTGMVVSGGDVYVPISGEETKEKLMILESLGEIEWDGGISLSSEQEFVTGVFDNKCSDTCFVEMPLSAQRKYRLIFMIEPGTKVKINKIIYTLKSDNI